MNKLTNNIPNRIKQPAQCCIHCGKSYKKKINLDKHLVICDLLQQSRKKQKMIIYDEDDEQIPSQRKIFEMLIELGQKYSRLEEKVEEINKWVVKKKKKINVLDWLNNNIKPNINFDNILEKIIINDNDVKNILINSFYDVLNEVFSRTIYNFNELENPIFAFVQKQNVFYIYDSNGIWIELTRERLIKFLNKVHMKIFKEFNDWKKINSNEIKSDSSLATICDKTLVKIMSVEFNQESILSKVRASMFSRMKTDMKALVEFEFEF
jgi:uncharacterized protein YeeX (DUF496 family)